jgi:hypothetical protein
MVVDGFHLEINRPRKTEATIQSQMMAPKASGDTVLGRHHPPVAPRTRAGLIRTTRRKIRGAMKPIGKIRSFTMAKCDICVRHQISRMALGSQ